MSRHYAVFGHPVAHSLSPQIHVAFGRQTGIAVDYRTHEAAPSQFADAYHRLLKAGADGIVSVHLSAKLSGTYEAACLAATEIGDQVPGTREAQPVAPALLARVLPVGQPGAERVRRLGQRREPQVAPELPVVVGQHPEIHHGEQDAGPADL